MDQVGYFLSLTITLTLHHTPQLPSPILIITLAYFVTDFLCPSSLLTGTLALQGQALVILITTLIIFLDTLGSGMNITYLN